MQLWKKGHATARVKREIGDGLLPVVIAGKLKPVKRSEVGQYCDEQFWDVLGIWHRWKRFGFPWTGGWAEQPAYLVDLIDMVEDAINGSS